MTEVNRLPVVVVGAAVMRLGRPTGRGVVLVVADESSDSPRVSLATGRGAVEVTGGTVMAAAVYLKSQGALSVSVAATHHLYVPGAQAKLEKSEIDEVVVSDSVAESIKHPKLVVLSIAPIIAEEISGYQRDSR